MLVHLRIIDRDVIELSNLHRQMMFDEDDVGQVKVEVAAKKLQKLNPECKIEALAVSVNDYTALEVVEGCDVVIDALDSVNARYALNKACVNRNSICYRSCSWNVWTSIYNFYQKNLHVILHVS